MEQRSGSTPNSSIGTFVGYLGLRRPVRDDRLRRHRPTGPTLKRSGPGVHCTDIDGTAEVPMAEPAMLLAAVREHDQAAFTQLVAAFDRDLLRLAYVITGSQQAAEDAAQTAWERLWGKPPHLRADEVTLLAADGLRQRGAAGGPTATAPCGRGSKGSIRLTGAR